MKALLVTTAIAVHALLVGAFLLAYAARYVPPSTLWWLQLLGIGLPFLSLGVVGATLWAGVTEQRALFALYVVLSTLAFVRYAPRGERGAPPPGVESLRVVTFNADTRYVGSPEVIQALLDEYHPDVVALQEAGVWGMEEGMVAAAAFLPLLQDPGFFLPEPEGGWGSDVLRLPVFSQTRWVSVERVPLETDPDDEDRGEVVRAELGWAGVRFAVYNLHLHSFGPERPWRGGWRERLSPLAWGQAFLAYRDDFLIRAEEARQVRAMLEAEPLPFLVCGDLNSTPDQWVYGHLSRGLTDAFAAAGRGYGGTYHARFPFARIDYILASEHWVVSSARVLREAASDHRPVGAVLHLSDYRPSHG